MLIETLPLQQRIRDFLKVRTSYDVLPLSFRLIIFDTSLLVKKSLTILTQNGELLLCLYLVERVLIGHPRHCLSAVVGFEDIDIRWTTHDLGLYQFDPVLLAESRRSQSH